MRRRVECKDTLGRTFLATYVVSSLNGESNRMIEMGDVGVFNTTGSKLWQKVVLLFQEQLKEQYSFTLKGPYYEKV